MDLTQPFCFNLDYSKLQDTATKAEILPSYPTMR